MDAKKLRKIGIIVLLCASVLASAADKPKKNILFLMSDDFNCWTKAHGYNPQAVTPNLDKLSGKGILFTNAYCSSPVCNPSRNSLWSGFRPSTTGIQGNTDGYIRDIPGFANIQTMNQYFKQNGYWVYGAGKLYHQFNMSDNNVVADVENFSERYKESPGCKGGDYLNWANPGWANMTYSVNSEPMTEANCADYKMVNAVAQFLGGYPSSANKDKPFFIACGVFLPHLPWNVPKQFYDMFKTEDIKLPQGYKDGDLTDTGESRESSHTGVLTDGKWKESIHLYLAGLALTDHNVGILLNALEASPYKDNTIVCFMGDHGWHLGEKERWGKASMWDMASRTTLIIYDPSAIGNGKICTKVVGLQDLYPTLVELSGVPIKTDIEGNSLAALFENPSRADWDNPFVGSYRGVDYIQTNKYRYVRDNVIARRMLYDKQNDPYEFTNLYLDVKYASVIATLNKQLDSVIAIGASMKSKLLGNYSFVPKPLTIPGVIEAEDYDEGGYSQTYYDADKQNAGGQYRKADGTDIYITDDAKGSYHLGDLSAGDWCIYTVKDYLAGDYNVDFRVKNSSALPAVIEVYNRGAMLAEVNVPAGTNSWHDIRASQITLANQPSTRLQVRVKSGSGLQLNSIAFEMINTSNRSITANHSRKCIENTVVVDNVLYLDLTNTSMMNAIEIFDASGKQLSNEKVPGEQRVQYHAPVSLRSGVYLLRISDGFDASVEKFVVQ